MDTTQHEENGFSLYDLFQLIKKNIILIVLLSLLFGALMIVYTTFVANEKYVSRASVMVQVQADPNVEGSYDFLTAQRLLATIADLMSMDIVVDEVINSLSLDMTTKQLKSGLTVQSSSTSFFITINYIHEDDALTARVVNQLIDEAIELVNTNSAFSSLSNKIARASYAQPGVYHSPNKVLFVIIGLFVGAIFGFLVIFFKNYFSNTYKTQEEVEASFNLQVLGVIPYYEMKEGKNNGKLR